MKKLVLFLMGVLLLVPAAAMGAACTVDLIAGGGNEESAQVVGTVTTYSSDGGLTWAVTYQTTGAWQITEVHLDVACNSNDVPQKNGNPIPGQFDYKAYPPAGATTFSFPGVQPLNAAGEVCQAPCAVFAAHAVVLDTSDCVDDVCRKETAWAEGMAFSGKNWATYFTCCCETEVCGDGLDNDCDGLTDCSDSDCSGDPACTGSCSVAPDPTLYPNETCVSKVQQMDPYCCTTDWDSICADEYCACDPTGPTCAPEVCSVAPDPALYPNGACVSQVQQMDSYCCTIGWDSYCAASYCGCDPTGPACGGTTPEVCNDGSDNDGDGLKDCFDSDCANDPGCGDPNSCVGHCGGMAPGGCYCDDKCLTLGDCCADACSECGYCPAP